MTAPTTILTSFSGISDPGNYPPENALAVGPESIVTAESVPYEVTNLSGGAATTGSNFSCSVRSARRSTIPCSTRALRTTVRRGDLS